MNKRRLLRVVLRMATAVLLLVLFGFINHRRREAQVNNVEVVLKGDSTIHFLTESDVLRLLKEKNVAIKGAYADLDLMKAENTILEHPAVKAVKVWTTMEGTFWLEVEQRQPLLRIIDLLGNTYYMDADGGFMPTQEQFSARVPVATGFIADRFYLQGVKIPELKGQDSLLAKAKTDDLYAFMKEIAQDPMLMALTEQFYVDFDGGIELITKCGPERVLLGPSNEAKEQLQKLKIFYTQAIPQVGWDAYAAINLKYRDQIICTKKHAEHGI